MKILQLILLLLPFQVAQLRGQEIIEKVYGIMNGFNGLNLVESKTRLNERWSDSVK